VRYTVSPISDALKVISKYPICENVTFSISSINSKSNFPDELELVPPLSVITFTLAIGSKVIESRILPETVMAFPRRLLIKSGITMDR